MDDPAFMQIGFATDSESDGTSVFEPPPSIQGSQDEQDEDEERPTQTSIAARVPTEILLQIFAECIDEEVDPDGIGFSGNWIKSITHVCRSWREIAIDYPALWANIAFLSPHMTRAMLDRSKDVFINIHANLTPDYLQGFGVNGSRNIMQVFKGVRRALSHTSRVKEINLRSRQCKYFSRLIKEFPAEAPHLERLALRAITHENSVVFEVPSELFSHEPLPLHHLEFECCSIPRSLQEIIPSHCSALTHLELHYVAPLSRQFIINMLAAAAETIETVHIDLISPFSSSFLSSGHLPTITLPHLRSFYFRDRAEVAFGVLRHLVLSPTARLRVEIGLSALTPTFQYNPLATHAATGTPVRSLLLHHAPQRLCEPHERGLRLLGFTDPSAPEYFFNEPDDAKDDVHFACWEDAEGHILRDALGRIWRALAGGGQHVQALTVARVGNVPPGTWLDLLDAVPEVVELCVHGSAALRALCAALAAGEHPPALPKLRTLTVYEAAFRVFPEYRMGSGTRDADFKALMECLRARKAAGIAIERLVVCYSDAGRVDMEDLGVEVDKLVWDGSLFGKGSVPIPEIGAKVEREDEDSDEEA